MSSHDHPYEQSTAVWAINDPGASGTINATFSGVVKLVSATTETRTLGDPTFLNQNLVLEMDVDGGDITVTASTAFDEAGDTTLVFDDAGEYAQFIAIEIGTALVWRLTSVSPGVSGSLVATDNVYIRGRLYIKQATPQTATGTASLTDAQMIGGILVGTPAATATYTVRTGTQLEAALGGDIANDDSFDLTVINLGSAGDIITMAVASGITFVGSVTIDDPGADIPSSGTFRFRRVSANVFVAYRLN
jgi:hypothetical protein